MPYLDNIKLMNSRILSGSFRNFSGAKTRYNDLGNRNFCIAIDDEEQAQDLLDLGWNVKCRPPREEGDAPLHYIKANIRFQSKTPAVVYVVKNGRRTLLTEDTIGMLDSMRITKVDVELIGWKSKEALDTDPYSTYVKTLYVHVEVDDFANLYMDDNTPLDTDELPFD